MKRQKKRLSKQSAKSYDSTSQKPCLIQDEMEINGVAECLLIPWRKGWLFALFLLIATLLAYQPVWHADFIWDDDVYVTDNTLLHSLDGLRQIWFTPGATVQYYPLTFTTFWLEYHLWGLHPSGYHLVNVTLHAGNAILLWLILRRLDVRGGWLAAGIFALHPVCVESVAWVTELKNTLSCLFFLGSSLAALRFWLPDRILSGVKDSTPLFGSWKFYWLALGLYVCALWSKTAAVPLPVVILLLVWWQRGRPAWRNLYPLGLFLAVGLVMGLMTMHIESQIGASGKSWSVSWLERCLIASRDMWFYLGKLLWPYPLIFSYPRWRIDATQIPAYLALLSALVGFCILWMKRNSWGRPMLFALAYFLVMLFPVSGFFNVYYFSYTFVADHFQYLACLGPLTLAAAGIIAVSGLFQKVKPSVKFTAYLALLLTFGTLTWRQSRMYADIETLWRTTLVSNPGSFMARDNLGYFLLKKGAVDEAMVQFRTALASYPDDATAHNDLGSALIEQGKLDAALLHIQRALEIEPNYAEAYNTLGDIFLKKRDAPKAMGYFHKALDIQPDLADAQYNLGNAFLQQGQMDAAIESWQKTLEIQPNHAMAHNNLGTALWQKGRKDEAMIHFQKAVEIKPDFADANNNLADVLIQNGRAAEAIQYWQNTLAIKPDFVAAQNDLAWVLATCPIASLRNGSEAIRLAQQANQQSGGANPTILRTLAAAYAEGGQFSEAVVTVQEAMQLAGNQPPTPLLNNLRAQIIFYQMDKPIRDTDLTNAPARLNR